MVCKTDEVGEICVHSAATGTQYWGLQGLTNNNFKVQPLQAEGQPLGDAEYTRSGLLGFLGPGNLVFVCGSRDGLMTVTGRKHNADDIIATVLAVEPMKFIYRGRIAVFSVRVLRDERICVVAEQRPDCSEEEVGFSNGNRAIIANCAIIKTLPNFPELPMDVASFASGGLDTRGRNILSRSGATQLFAKDPSRRNPLVRNEEALPRGHPAPGQRFAVPPHLCHQSAKAT